MDRKFLHFGILISFLICLFYPARAQEDESKTALSGEKSEPFLLKIGISQGLPSLKIYDIHLDQKGYLWIATEVGMVKYNGYNFKIFSLPSKEFSAVSFIQEDKNGNIWFQSFHDHLFKIEKDTLKQIYPFGNFFPKLGGYQLLGDSLLYFSNNLIYCPDIKKPQDENPPVFWSDPTGSPIRRIYVDSKKNTWIVTEKNGVWRYDHKKKSELILQINYRGISFPFIEVTEHNNIVFIADHLSNTLFIYQNDIIKEYKYNSLFKSKKHFQGIRYIPGRGYWLLTQDGIYELGFDFEKAPKGPFYKGIYFGDLILDKGGNFWLSSLNQGLFLIPSFRFKQFPDLPKKILTTIDYPENSLLVGAEDGRFYKINRNENKIEVFKTDFIDPVSFLFYLREVNILLVGSETGFEIRDGLKKIIFKADLDALKEVKMGRTPNEMLMAFHNRAVAYQFSRKGNKIDIKIDSFAHERTRTIARNKSDNSIVYSGLTGTKVVKVNGEIVPLLDENNLPLFSKSIIADSRNQIWLNTFQQGVYIFREGKIFDRIDIKNDLNDEQCQIMVNAPGKVFLITPKYIWQYDIYKSELSRISVWPVDAFVNKARYIDGSLWLSTSEGLVEMQLDEYVPPKQEHPVYIQSVSSGLLTFDASENIEFPYINKEVYINFDGVYLGSLGRFNYSYRLIGLDSNWFEIPSGQNNLRFSSLRPGKYIFEIKITDNLDQKEAQVSQVKFAILQAFWQKSWFIILVSVGLVLLFVLIVFAVVKNREQSLKVAEALRKYQLAALRAQMNPHFIFNALNSIQFLIHSNEKKLANEYLGKFAELTRMTLDGSMQDRVSVSDEIKLLKIYLQLEGLRFDKNLTFKINDNDLSERSDIYIPPMIIQPYAENAILHGLFHKKSQGSLEIDFEYVENQHILKVRIKDDGVGRKTAEMIKQKYSAHRKSHGTGITQKRLELLNFRKKNLINVKFTDLENPDGSPAGTEVRLSIPVWNSKN